MLIDIMFVYAIQNLIKKTKLSKRDFKLKEYLYFQKFV